MSLVVNKTVLKRKRAFLNGLLSAAEQLNEILQRDVHILSCSQRERVIQCANHGFKSSRCLQTHLFYKKRCL